MSQDHPTSNPSSHGLARYDVRQNNGTFMGMAPCYNGAWIAAVDGLSALDAKDDEIQRLTRKEVEAERDRLRAALERVCAVDKAAPGRRDCDIWAEMLAEAAEALREESSDETSGDSADAARYRWLKQYLRVEDVGDDQVVYGLVVSHEDMEIAGTIYGMNGRTTVDECIDMARGAVKASERTCKWTPIEEGSPIYTPGCPGSEEWQLDDGCELYPYCQWCGGKIVVKALADEGPSENGNEDATT